MKVYSSDKIRNIVLLGHGGVGKTTVAEAMAFASGAITRRGSVNDGNTISDFDAEETKRHFSVNTSILPIEWEDFKINILDTPGYFDFVGEVEEALRAAEGAVIVVSAKSGVQVGTEQAWEKAEAAGLPRFIFVNGMDEEGANLVKVLEDLQNTFGKAIAPFQVPIKENGKFVGFVNVVKMEGRKFEGNRVVPCEVPDSIADEIEPVRQMILEAVAETDEELMERYFDGDEFTVDGQQKDHHWEKQTHMMVTEGSHVLVIGLGDIGTTFARKMKALGAHVTGIRKSRKPKPEYVDAQYTMEALPELLPQADIVALSLPGYSDTKGVIGEKELHLMKENTILLNVGRGTAIDSLALAKALQEGAIYGAGLDVTDPEPLPEDHPLWDAPHCIITPHVSGGYALPETLEKILELSIENLERYKKGETLHNIIDFSTGYVKR